MTLDVIFTVIPFSAHHHAEKCFFLWSKAKVLNYKLNFHDMPCKFGNKTHSYNFQVQYTSQLSVHMSGYAYLVQKQKMFSPKCFLSRDRTEIGQQNICIKNSKYIYPIQRNKFRVNLHYIATCNFLLKNIAVQRSHSKFNNSSCQYDVQKDFDKLLQAIKQIPKYSTLTLK